MVTIPKQTMISLCTTFGGILKTPSGIDGVKLMAAIAENESTFGVDCTPRYEKQYDMGGKYSSNPAQEALLSEYGKDAAYSYGPWQIMLINCSGFTPNQLKNDARICARCFVHFFNQYVMKFNPTTIEEIGQIYNGGHIFKTDPIPDGVKKYCQDLVTNYNSNLGV